MLFAIACVKKKLYEQINLYIYSQLPNVLDNFMELLNKQSPYNKLKIDKIHSKNLT